MVRLEINQIAVSSISASFRIVFLPLLISKPECDVYCSIASHCIPLFTAGTTTREMAGNHHHLPEAAILEQWVSMSVP